MPIPRSTDLVWESSERWVRAGRHGVPVVDSKHPVLVWEPRGHGARYAFPTADIRSELLRPSADPPTGRHGGATEYFDLVAGDKLIHNAAWRYPVADLADHVSFEWFDADGPVLDGWREEDEDVFVIPRDPYHRVDAIRSTRQVRVERDGQVLAETHQPVAVFETGLPVRYYIPPADVSFDPLIPSQLRTVCPYKGTASYWAMRDAPAGAADEIAWVYSDPAPSQFAIAGLLSFYDTRVDIIVDGVPVR